MSLIAARALRSGIARAAAIVALAALVLLPALHAPHAARGGVHFVASAATAIDAHAHAQAEAQGCSLCLAAAQARTALASTAHEVARLDDVPSGALERAALVFQPQRARAPAAPRAPPIV